MYTREEAQEDTHWNRVADLIKICDRNVKECILLNRSLTTREDLDFMSEKEIDELVFENMGYNGCITLDDIS
jgi:hypothetical protein